MNNTSKSAFQTKSIQVLKLEVNNAAVSPIDVNDLDTDLTGEYILGHQETFWFGVITMNYYAKMKDANPQFLFEMTMGATFCFDAENTQDNKDRFERLLKLNGAAALLLAMRTRVLSVSVALGIPQLIVPNINLKEFDLKNSSDEFLKSEDK